MEGDKGNIKHKSDGRKLILPSLLSFCFGFRLVEVDVKEVEGTGRDGVGKGCESAGAGHYARGRFQGVLGQRIVGVQLGEGDGAHALLLAQAAKVE